MHCFWLSWIKAILSTPAEQFIETILKRDVLFWIWQGDWIISIKGGVADNNCCVACL